MAQATINLPDSEPRCEEKKQRERSLNACGYGRLCVHPGVGCLYDQPHVRLYVQQSVRLYAQCCVHLNARRSVRPCDQGCVVCYGSVRSRGEECNEPGCFDARGGSVNDDQDSHCK